MLGDLCNGGETVDFTLGLAGILRDKYFDSYSVHAEFAIDFCQIEVVLLSHSLKRFPRFSKVVIQKEECCLVRCYAVWFL
jgi:hypothetical protein